GSGARSRRGFHDHGVFDLLHRREIPCRDRSTGNHYRGLPYGRRPDRRHRATAAGAGRSCAYRRPRRPCSNMKLDQLVAALPTRNSAIITLQEGSAVRHSFSGLAADVAKARANLTRWGVTAGVRVGVFAPNSYAYIVYDLALVDLGAIAVPFTDDFAGSLDRSLVNQYNIALMLLGADVKHAFGPEDDFVAFL